MQRCRQYRALTAWMLHVGSLLAVPPAWPLALWCVYVAHHNEMI